jgi:hypothetical protein
MFRVTNDPKKSTVQTYGCMSFQNIGYIFPLQLNKNKNWNYLRKAAATSNHTSTSTSTLPLECYNRSAHTKFEISITGEFRINILPLFFIFGDMLWFATITFKSVITSSLSSLYHLPSHLYLTYLHVIAADYLSYFWILCDNFKY